MNNRLEAFHYVTVMSANRPLEVHNLGDLIMRGKDNFAGIFAGVEKCARLHYDRIERCEILGYVIFPHNTPAELALDKDIELNFIFEKIPVKDSYKGYDADDEKEDSEDE